jgi:arabinogalactan oligomer/maltooligosaccharide transport system permease protein
MIGKKRFKRNLQILLVISITILLAVAALKFLQNGSWLFASFAGITAILVARTYWLGGSVHSKYLFPGVILLIFFHIYPAIYSGQVAFTNDSNGHQLSKGQAISAILEDSLIPIETQSPINYVITIGNSDGKVFAVFEYAGSYWAGNSQSLNKLNTDNLGFSPEGNLLAIKGYQILDESLQSDYSQEIQTLSIHVNSKLILSPSDYEYLEAYQPGRIYSEKEDQITDLTTKSLYSPNGNGQMVNSAGNILYPGWKINVGFRNFTSIINNSEVRRPLLAVLLWTFINAILAVFLSFIMGLVLALVFNLAEMKSKRIYRNTYFPAQHTSLSLGRTAFNMCRQPRLNRSRYVAHET